MDSAPWLTILGLGEDGPDGLGLASRKALEAAEVIIGPPRHLALIGPTVARQIEWPAPFEDGLALLSDLRGQKVVALASGDPFWFGAGRVIADRLAPGEWVSLPAPSTFSLAANRLGWGLESTPCLGLHAAPLDRLRPHLGDGARLLVTVRDGVAVGELCRWLSQAGFGATRVHVMEALGGADARVRTATAAEMKYTDIAHPVLLGLDLSGQGADLPLVPGLPDETFDHDGQITKRPVRALTLSALAPRPGEHLWDIGGGSGSIAIEWLLAHPSLRATSIEHDPDRAARITANARALGVDRLRVVQGAAPGALTGLEAPDAVFVGGGLSAELLGTLETACPLGCRLVANAVTLESEAVLAAWQARKGGDLLRIDLARATRLGARRGWTSAYPVVQWSGTL